MDITRIARTPAPDQFGRFCSDLGPGLITACAYDDPSGISTYSMAGAALG
jgi:Mn2+/Fe2+ NRAMP family transporter